MHFSYSAVDTILYLDYYLTLQFPGEYFLKGNLLLWADEQCEYLAQSRHSARHAEWLCNCGSVALGGCRRWSVSQKSLHWLFRRFHATDHGSHAVCSTLFLSARRKLNHKIEIAGTPDTDFSDGLYFSNHVHDTAHSCNIFFLANNLNTHPVLFYIWRENEGINFRRERRVLPAGKETYSRTWATGSPHDRKKKCNLRKTWLFFLKEILQNFQICHHRGLNALVSSRLLFYKEALTKIEGRHCWNWLTLNCIFTLERVGSFSHSWWSGDDIQ